MTVAESIADLLHLALSLVTLWALIFIFWRDYRIDLFRQELFKIRDQLFDYARDGNVDFRSPAYYLLRENINGMIRFADRVSFSAICLTYFSKAPTETRIQRWEKEIDRVNNPEVRENLKKTHNQFMLCVVNHMVKSSLSLRSIVYLLMT